MSRPMDELQQLLKNLHLSRMADTLPDELQRAEKEGLAYTEMLLRLVRAQWHHRQETALEWRIRQARLPERWALETFPFKDQSGVNKRQIMSLAELDFIPTATNLVFIGGCGGGAFTYHVRLQPRGIVVSISGRVPVTSRRLKSSRSSSRVPIVEPCTRN